MKEEFSMRRILTIFAASSLVSSVAVAGTIRDNCGCGIGTMALGDQEATVVSQLAVTFLNGICGNQTFGITSGTLECDQPARFASKERVIQYVADNMDHLVMDVAMDRGTASMPWRT